MLGFSFSKVIFTIGVVVALFWWIRKVSGGSINGVHKSSVTSDKIVEDMEPCPVCGSFFVLGSDKDCGCDPKV